MATEIERKFLLVDAAWRQEIERSTPIRQGYLSSDPGCSVRVRVAGTAAWLTIKGRTVDISRDEYEYAIPVADAERMLDSLARRPFIEKTRHLVKHAGHVWEIDEFAGDNAGLIVAEIELRSAAESFARPAWLGTEVSQDPRYRNAALVANPFSAW